MQRPLHIAILDEELPVPLTSGKRIRTFQLLRRLAGKFRISYIAHRNTDLAEVEAAQRSLRTVGITPIVVDHQIPAKSGLGFYGRLFGNLFSSLPYSAASHASVAMRLAMERLHAEDPVDVWHAEWTPYAQMLREPGQGKNLGPWVVMAHNVESLIWQRWTESVSHPVKRWYIGQQWRKFEKFERWAYGAADQAIAVSEEDAQLIRGRFQAPRVEVVDNGVDTAYFFPDRSIRRDPASILFLGSLDWRPNQDGVRLLLESIFPEVKRHEPNATLRIVGRKPPEWMRRQIQEQPGVELHADVADVRPFLHSAGMLAVPLRVGGGSRLKILEALATSLPVVTTKVGVEGLHLQDREHVLVADPQNMAAELIQAIRQPRAAEWSALRGRQRVLEQYDWADLANRLGQIWADVADRSVGDKQPRNRSIQIV